MAYLYLTLAERRLVVRDTVDHYTGVIARSLPIGKER